MKTTFYTICLVLSSLTVSAQSTLIVDHNFNAPTGSHIYSTIQAAVDAAANGDIIQIQPSPTAYGNAVIPKQLTIIGIGFNLTKEIPYTSIAGNLTLTSNIGSTENASGTTVTGLSFNTLTLGTVPGPAYTLSDVTLFNCVIATISGPSGGAVLDNLQIYGNSITSSVRFYAVINNSMFRNNVLRANYLDIRSASPSTITITNNIIYGYIYIAATGSSVPILNNDFIGASPSSFAFSTLYDKVVANNIFYGRTPAVNAAGTASTSYQNNIFTNNLTISTGNDALPPAGSTNTGSGNLVGVSPALTNVAVSNSWSGNYDYTLMSGSAAINAGSDGTDIGITGGAYPWTEPNLILKTTAAPTIEILNTSTIINPGDNLPVRVKAISN